MKILLANYRYFVSGEPERYFKSGNTTELLDNLLLLLEKVLQEKGLDKYSIQLAEKYNWQKIAMYTNEVYEKVLHKVNAKS